MSIMSKLYLQVALKQCGGWEMNKGADQMRLAMCSGVYVVG